MWRLDDHQFSKLGGCAQFPLGLNRYDRNICGLEVISKQDEHGFHYQICLLHTQLEYQSRLERRDELQEDLDDVINKYGDRVTEKPVCPDCRVCFTATDDSCACPSSTEEE